MPTIGCFGFASPVKALEKKGLALRKPASDRVTVDACTLTSTSFVGGNRPRDLFDAQHLRRPVSVCDDCLHDFFLSSVRCR